MNEYEIDERFGRFMEEIETKWPPYILARLRPSTATCEAEAGQTTLEEASTYRSFASISRWQRIRGRP